MSAGPVPLQEVEAGLQLKHSLWKQNHWKVGCLMVSFAFNPQPSNVIPVGAGRSVQEFVGRFS